MLNWYSEYLLSRARMLESACAAEAGRRLAESRNRLNAQSLQRPSFSGR
jgi:hypothetical protein